MSSHFRVLRYVALQAPLLAVTWFAYTGKVNGSEAAVGAAAVALATFLGALVGRQDHVAGVRALGPLARGWRLPWYFARGAWEVVRAGVRQLFRRVPAASLHRHVAYRAGGDDDRARARRVLAVTFTTMTPNFIVIDILREERLLLYHQIVAGPVPRMTRELGAGT